MQNKINTYHLSTIEYHSNTKKERIIMKKALLIRISLASAMQPTAVRNGKHESLSRFLAGQYQ